MFKILLQAFIFLWSFLCYCSVPPIIKHTYNNGSKPLVIANQQGPSAGDGIFTLPVPVSQGGTGAATLLNHGVLLGQATSPIVATAVGATGTVLIGNTAADPSFSATPSVTSMTIASLPTVGTDAANKMYVDMLVIGLKIKASCVAASTVALTVTYLNGAAGVGATLTNAGVLAAFSIDGQSPTVGQRVLIKNQADQAQNGIYTVTTVGSGVVAWVLTRATDFDTSAEILAGTLVPVISGTMHESSLWLETATVTTIGTDPIVFSTFLIQGVDNLLGNSGTATGLNVTVAGGNNILTSGAGSTLTVNVAGTTNHAVQIGNASNSLTSIALGTLGQALVSAGAGADPSFGTLPVAGGGTGAITLTSNGVLLGHGTSAVTATTAGTNGQVLLGSTGADPSFVTPTAGTGLSLTTNATTLQYGLSTPVLVANGGTGATTLTSHGVLLGEGTSAITATAVGASGIPLIGQGGATDPVFGTAVVAGGGTGVASLTAYALMAGGTTSTNPVQSLASVGNLDDVLSSSGAGALPVWRSSVRTSTVTLSAAQVLALNTTPITVVSAPGAGKIVHVLSCVIKLNYTGTAFTGGSALSLAYTGPTNMIATAMTSAVKNQSSNQIAWTFPANETGRAYTDAANLAVVVYCAGAATSGGGTNTIVVTVTYEILTI